MHPQFVRLRRLVMAVFTVSSVVAAMVAPVGSGVAAARPADLIPAVPPVGADLYHLDTDNGLYTQGDSGSIQLQLFDSPIGIPSRQGWQLRDPSLSAATATGAIGPATLPFGLQIAPTSAGSTLLTLTSKNAQRLAFGVGLISLNGQAPGASAAQLKDDTATYLAPVASSPSDVIVRATSVGAEVSVLLHSASEAGPIVLSLAPDPRTYLDQKPSGAIVAIRPITTSDDTGAPVVVQSPEYVVNAAAATDSGTDPATPAQVGKVAMALSTDPTGPRTLALTVDPAWIHDPARVFPVRVDLPIATAYGAAHSQVLGTVDSCAAASPAAPAVVVGVEGACSYHGLMRFDLASLPPGSNIVSATLRLYTPNQVGPTGVLLYPNAPAWQPDLAIGEQPPSWQDAPTVITGTSGIAQSASDGHWQSWDVTSLVQGWTHSNRSYNTGFTLVSTGAPVLFAAPLQDGNNLSLLPSAAVTSTITTAASTHADGREQPRSRIEPRSGAARQVAADAHATMDLDRTGRHALAGRTSPYVTSPWVQAMRHTRSGAWSVRLRAGISPRRSGLSVAATAKDTSFPVSTVPGQCYLIPNHPNLCLPMMSPPNITVGPPAVSIPTPQQCLPVAGTGFCVPVVPSSSPSSASPEVTVPTYCLLVDGEICIPSVSTPTLPQAGTCYHIPTTLLCLPLFAPRPTRPRLPGAPGPTRGPVKKPVNISGGSPPIVSVPVLPNVSGCLSSVKPCLYATTPVLDMVFTQPGKVTSQAAQYSGPANDSFYYNNQNDPFGLASGGGWSDADIQSVAPNGSGSSLYGSYIRASVDVQCDVPQPGAGWWQSYGPNGYNGGPGANPNNNQGIYTIMQHAWDNGLSPIINLDRDYGSSCGYGHSVDWQSEGQDFINSSGFYSFPYPTLFEIVNEPNVGMPQAKKDDYQNYQDNFANAATGLYNALVARGIYNFSILTGGVIMPDASTSCDQSNDANISVSAAAVAEAEYLGVNSAQLGAAVHPYSYDRGVQQYPDDPYWLNYNETDGQGSGSMCFDYGDMTSLWTSSFYDEPVVTTEINWMASANANNTYYEGAYLVDLFTWLYDHDYNYQNTGNPVITTWFTNKDFPVAGSPPFYLGLTDMNGNDKITSIPYCPNNSGLEGSYPLTTDFSQTSFYPCY